MEQRYLPAVVELWKPFFFDRERFPDTYRPQVLVSYSIWENKPLHPAYLNSPDRFVFGDSGGFSIVSRGYVPDPERVIRWQIENCNVGVILDVPPFRIRGKHYQATRGAWDNSLERTLHNVRMAKQYYRPDEHPFRWWGVVQGETLDYMNRWSEAVAEVYPFDGEGEGWAIKPTPANTLESMARSVQWMERHRPSRVHMLMSTGVKTMAILFSLLKIREVDLDFISYDSASAGIYTGNRHAWTLTDDGLQVTEWLPRVYEPEDHLAMAEECPCAGCQEYRKVAPTKEGHSAVWRYSYDMLFVHNNIILFELFDSLAAQAKEDPEALLKLYLGDRYGKALRLMERGSPPKTVPVGMMDRILDQE